MTREVGLDQLYAPGEGEPVIADIVFVHGMNGDRRESWTKTPRKGQVIKHDPAASGAASTNLSRLNRLVSRIHLDRKEVISRSSQPQTIPGPGSVASPAQTGQSSKVFWPQDLLPKDVSSCRVYTWGYNVDIRYLRGSRSTATILDHSRALVSDLVLVRRLKEEEDRPLIFVAHSLGGVVVKKALNMSNEESGPLKAVCNATYGICFLGTPHRGSSKADLIDTLSRLSKLWGNVPNTKITQVLMPEAEILRDVHDSFIKNPINSKVKIYTFHEGLDFKGLTIVDRLSSTLGLPNEVQSDIPADHVNMAKFDSRTDQGYKRVTSALQRLVDGIQSSSSQGVLSSADMTAGRSQMLTSLFSSANQISRLLEELANDAVTFSNWLKEPNCTQEPIFWIRGRPGSGKSTLMKFALNDQRTQELLQSSHESLWSLIPFFFHDRGSDVQKTVSGLLQALLHQLLDKHRELVPLIYHIRLNHLLKWMSSLGTLKGVEIGGGNFDSQWHQTNATRARQLMKAVDEEKSRQDKKRQVVSELLWQPGEVDEALDVIVRQSKVELYCLLFIDALDEHSGDHEKLLEALKRFTNRDGTGAAHIKLCLASRPESLFLKVLGDSPGFAIHDYTQPDIETYTFGRLENVFTDQDRSYDLTMLEQLAGEVTQKANGVFIWVKLVVNDLVEAVIDGSSVTQLKRVLSSLPDDLMQLYRRIIQKRKQAYLEEAYVMFQLVLHSKHSLSLEALMAATDVTLDGQWDPVPDDVMRRRLVSRCGGLLDLVSGYRDENLVSGYRDEEVVQLVHQTLKKYLRDSQNATLGLSFPVKNPETDGLEYLLKYSVYIATKMNREAIEKHSKPLSYTFDTACKLECAGVDVSSEIDGLLKMSVVETDRGQMDGLSVWRKSRTLDRPEIRPRSGDTRFARKYHLASVAAHSGCIRYVRQKVVDGLPVTLSDRRPLILSVVIGLDRLMRDERGDDASDEKGRLGFGNHELGALKARTEDTLELLDLLVAKGSDVNCEWDGRTPLSHSVMNHSISSFTIVQWLLEHGAGPNRMFLHAIAYRNADSVELTKLFLQSGLDPMMKDSEGYTYLYYAIEFYEIERGSLIAEFLCQYGADPTQLGNGIDALNPESFVSARSVDSLWMLREDHRGSTSGLHMRAMLQHYSDPKNRGLARRLAVANAFSMEDHQGLTDREGLRALDTDGWARSSFD